MENRPFRPHGMHPGIAQLFADTADRPPPDHGVSLELCAEPDSIPPRPSASRSSGSTLDAIWSCCSTHIDAGLTALLPSIEMTRRTPSAGWSRRPGFPRHARQPLSAATVAADQGDR